MKNLFLVGNFYSTGTTFRGSFHNILGRDCGLEKSIKTDP